MWRKFSKTTFTFLDSSANLSRLNQMMKTEFLLSPSSVVTIQLWYMNFVIKTQGELVVNSWRERSIKMKQQEYIIFKRTFLLAKQSISINLDSRFKLVMNTLRNIWKIILRIFLNQVLSMSLTKSKKELLVSLQWTILQ